MKLFNKIKVGPKHTPLPSSFQFPQCLIHFPASLKNSFENSEIQRIPIAIYFLHYYFILLKPAQNNDSTALLVLIPV